MEEGWLEPEVYRGVVKIPSFPTIQAHASLTWKWMAWPCFFPELGRARTPKTKNRGLSSVT